jgi:hypothetical protein
MRLWATKTLSANLARLPDKVLLQKSPSRAERSRLASVSERPRGAGLGLEREHGSGMPAEVINQIQGHIFAVETDAVDPLA